MSKTKFSGVRDICKELLDLTEEVERLGSMKSALSEVQSLHAQATKDLGKSREKLAEANAAVETSISDAKRIVSEAIGKADDIAARAGQQANETLRKAESKAEDEWRKALAKKTDIETLTRQAQVAYDTVVAELEAKRADLAKIEKRLEEIRQKVA